MTEPLSFQKGILFSTFMKIAENEIFARGVQLCKFIWEKTVLSTT